MRVFLICTRVRSLSHHCPTFKYESNQVVRFMHGRAVHLNVVIGFASQYSIFNSSDRLYDLSSLLASARTPVPVLSEQSPHLPNSYLHPQSFKNDHTTGYGFLSVSYQLHTTCSMPLSLQMGLLSILVLQMLQ